MSLLVWLIVPFYNFYWQHCAQRKPPVFSLLRGRFWCFLPHRGDTLHRLGWNLARKNWGADLRSPPLCPISPLWVQQHGCRTPKTELFTHIWPKRGIQTPSGAYPLRDFHKICRVCTPFQDALAVKIWLDLREGLRSYEVLIWGGLVPPNFKCP